MSREATLEIININIVAPIAAKLSLAAASNEVHDFETVAVMDWGGVPASARDDIAIEFDGNSIRLRTKVLDQRRKVCYFGKFLVLTVD
jgi:hypothetical protein